MPAEELEAAEQIGPGVPPQTCRNVIRVNPEVQLRLFLVTVRVEREGQPGAERLVPRRPVQLRKVGVKRGGARLVQSANRQLTQDVELRMKRRDDRATPLLAMRARSRTRRSPLPGSR